VARLYIRIHVNMRQSQ